jgi:hypothetical protein
MRPMWPSIGDVAVSPSAERLKKVRAEPVLLRDNAPQTGLLLGALSEPEQP